MNAAIAILPLLWIAAAIGTGMVIALTPSDRAGAGIVALIAGAALAVIMLRSLSRAASQPGRARGRGAVAAVTLPEEAGRRAKAVDARFFRQIIIVALLAKLMATILRALVVKLVYGYSDATVTYDPGGKIVAAALRGGHLREAFSQFALGTPFVEIFTGFVYAPTASNFWVGWAIFSFLAFLGSHYYLKAYRTAFPEAKWKFFAVLIFFYPAILFWPAGIGKDSLLFFSLGLASYGVAKLIARNQVTGLIPLAIGLGMATLIRPHIGGVAGISLGAAALLRKPSINIKALVIQVVVVVGAVAGGLFLAKQAASFLGLGGISLQDALTFLVQQSQNVAGEGESGGSDFRPPTPGTLSWLYGSFIVVLIRPFPWEAGNPQGLIQSLDGVLMASLLLFTSFKGLKALAHMRKEPFLVYSLVFAVAGVLILSSVSNFGILARQRSTVLPFLFILASYSPAAVRSRPAPARRGTAPASHAREPVVSAGATGGGPLIVRRASPAPGAGG